MQPQVVTILADTAIRSADIDEAAVLRSKEEAERVLANRGESIEASPANLAQGVAGALGSVTLNLIFASCSGALPILRRNGSQRGSLWILSNRFSVVI